MKAVDEIEINNNNTSQVSNKFITIVVKKTIALLREQDKNFLKKSFFLSIGLVGKKEIKKINNRYRQKNQTTDVLSFGYENTERKIEGEIVLCFEVIEENAIKYKIEPTKELKKNIIHGILHLAGYQHGEKMFSLQSLFLNQIKSV